MPKLPKKSDMVAHVADVVSQNHRVNHTDMARQLQSLGFSWGDANGIIDGAVKKKLIRTDGSSLRPPMVSTLAHLEQDNMTGWWGIYVNGEYAGQRPEKAQAQAALDALVKGKKE